MPAAYWTRGLLGECLEEAKTVALLKGPGHLEAGAHRSSVEVPHRP